MSAFLGPKTRLTTNVNVGVRSLEKSSHIPPKQKLIDGFSCIWRHSKLKEINYNVVEFLVVECVVSNSPRSDTGQSKPKLIYTSAMQRYEPKIIHSTCTAIYAIARGCTEVMLRIPATWHRVRRSPVVLLSLEWRCVETPSCWSLGSNSADVGDVNIYLNA